MQLISECKRLSGVDLNLILMAGVLFKIQNWFCFSFAAVTGVCVYVEVL